MKEAIWAAEAKGDWEGRVFARMEWKEFILGLEHLEVSVEDGGEEMDVN